MRDGRIALASSLALAVSLGCTSGGGIIDRDASADRADSGATTMDASADAQRPPREPVVFINQGAPTDSPNRFGGARSTVSPVIAYPRDGVLLPPNLSGLEIHFEPHGHTLFEVRFEQAGELRMQIYDDCDVRGEGCAFELGDVMWEVLAADREAGPYQVRIRGVGAEGDLVGESDAISIELASEAVTGGLYFWATEPAAIHRYDFDRSRPTSELFYDATDSGGHCVGCHALSRDGSIIGIGYGTEGPIAMVHVATRRVERTIAGEMAAFSPDGTELVVGGVPELGDRAPLAIKKTDGTGTPIELGEGMAPDWSPDGDAIVFTDPDGALRLLERADGGEWELRSEPLARSDGLDQFGSFAPDSSWIAFSRLVEDATGGLRSHVYVVRRSGGAAQRIERASTGTNDSMPRWNPSLFLHRGRRLFWLTFTTDMRYGVEPHDGRRRMIWMAAFDPDSDGDRSRPAFRLPNQPTTGSNFIPQWTTRVERQPCEEDEDCRSGEICVGGVCVPDLI